MANVKNRNGNKEVRFTNAGGKYSSFYAGKVSHSAADALGCKLERIVSSIKQNQPLSHSLSEWIGGLSDDYHQKLSRLGLVEQRVPVEVVPVAKIPTIKQWTDTYITEHSCSVKTREQLEIVQRGLLKFFDPDKRLDTFNAADSERYRKWLETKGMASKKYKTGLGKQTVRRRIGRTKQFFNFAVKDELINRNLFAGEASATSGNPDRFAEVLAEMVERLIRHAPDEDFRLMLALVRYGGLRRHECSIQRWADIDIPNRRMTIRSDKKPPLRKDVPIFPELLPHIMRAREMAPANQQLMQASYPKGMNVTKRLNACAARAEVLLWGKPWQNMRATRETELIAAEFQINAVTSWLGNSPKIAERHYLMVQQESFQRAISVGCAPNAPNNAPKLSEAKGGNPETVKTGEKENLARDGVILYVSQDALPQNYPVRTLPCDRATRCEHFVPSLQPRDQTDHAKWRGPVGLSLELDKH